jgi:hypothetical protein
MGCGRLAGRARPRQPRQQPVEQRQRQVEARLRPPRAGGIRQFQRGCAVHARQARHQLDEIAVKRRTVLLHQLHGRADGSFGEGGDGLGAGIARQGEFGLSQGSQEIGELSGSNRSVRQRERMVGNRPEGWCETRNITVFFGGSSSSLSSALAAEGFISSAQSTITTRRAPPSEDGEKPLEAAHFVHRQLRLEAFALRVPGAPQQQEVGLRQGAETAGDGVFGIDVEAFGRGRRE